MPPLDEAASLDSATANVLENECFPAVGNATSVPTASLIAASFSSLSRCVVSFSLYGDSERYTGGALANARMIGHSVLPHWRMRVYHDYSANESESESVRSSRVLLLASLEALGVELVDVSQLVEAVGFGGQLFNGRTWRFSVASDSSIARYLIRDVDSRVSAREGLAVNAWVRSGRPFHAMRDHPSHTIYAKAGFPMQAGMWGGTSEAVPEMNSLLVAADSSQDYIADQVFLRDSVWPIALSRGVLQHDSFGCSEHVRAFSDSEPFPGTGRAFPEDFVGAVVLGDGSIRTSDNTALLATPQPARCWDRPSTARHEQERWRRQS